MSSTKYRYYVIKITGYLFQDDTIDELYKIAKYIKSLFNEKKYLFVIVTGGGRQLRVWINFLRKYSNISEYDLDIFGIYYSRLNALIFKYLLHPYVVDKIPASIDEAIFLIKKYNLNVVMGGVSPGFSTNAVAAYLSAYLSTSLINMTRVGAVYDTDPEKYPNAKKFNKLSIDELIRILKKYEESAGHYPLFDKSSLNIIKSYRVPTYVTGPDMNSLKELFEEGRYGTFIYP